MISGNEPNRKNSMQNIRYSNIIQLVVFSNLMRGNLEVDSLFEKRWKNEVNFFKSIKTEHMVILGNVPII